LQLGKSHSAHSHRFKRHSGAYGFYNVPGVSIAVIKDFQIDYFQVYGVKDVQTQEPVAGETLFQAASISKSVSAMAAVKFVQDGKILFEKISTQS